MTEDSKNRSWRTLFQSVLAVLIAIPVALGALPIDVEGDVALWISGTAGALVVLITAVQTALEDHGLFRIMRPRGDVNHEVT